MAAAGIDTAVRNLLAVGCPLERIALLDNFCWCSSHDPARLWQLKETARACHDIAVAYGTPFISGKDSMFNDFCGYDADDRPVAISVPPTLLISSLGVIPHVRQVRSFAFQEPGDLLYLIGEMDKSLGGSEFQAMLKDEGLLTNGQTGLVPRVRTAEFRVVYEQICQLVARGLCRSLHPLAQGGLAAALGKSAMAHGLGAAIRIPDDRRVEHFLFAESMGCFLVSVGPGDRRAFESATADIPCLFLGEVSGDASLEVRQGKIKHVEVPVATLLAAYRQPFAAFQGD